MQIQLILYPFSATVPKGRLVLRQLNYAVRDSRVALIGTILYPDNKKIALIQVVHKYRQPDCNE